MASLHGGWIALLAAVLGLALTACNNSIGTFWAPVAAVVGGQQITEAEVDAQVQLNNGGNSSFGNLQQGPDANLVRLDAKQQMLSIVIQQVALSHQAAKLGLSVTPTALSASVNSVRAEFTSEADFKKSLEQAGITLADLTEAERLTLTANNLSTSVQNGINATPAEIAAAYQQDASTYQASYDAAQILICANADPSTHVCSTTPADLALAQQVDQEAQSGADFGQLAAEYSADTSTRDNGGDLGWEAPGALIPQFEQAALALQVGQITAQPIETDFGYSIIKLVNKGETLADATPSINANLEQDARSQALDEYLSKVIAATPITVNPQFGTFDRKTLSVASPPGAVPSPASDSIGGTGGLTGP
ncbi:MAG: peptidylprolyl isomerase [Actinomycetota bacterium]